MLKGKWTTTDWSAEINNLQQAVTSIEQVAKSKVVEGINETNKDFSKHIYPCKDIKFRIWWFFLLELDWKKPLRLLIS